MLVTFTGRDSSNRPASITVDARVVMTDNLPVMGQPGQATITLPLGSDALNSDYIDPDGLSRVRISGHTDISEWNGWIQEIDEGPDVTVIHAVQWWGELMYVPVAFGREFRGVTPDVIARQAMSASPWQIVTAATSGPNIRTWTFDGETVWDHLQRMMQLANQELYPTADGQFRWGTMTGTRYEPVLVAPRDIAARHLTNASERVSKVSTRSGDDWYTAVETIHGWSAHAVIKQDATASQMVTLAENEMIRRKEPVRTVTGRIDRNHWSINLGDPFSVFVPYARLGAGALRGCRITATTYDSAADRLDVAIQVLVDSPVVGVPGGGGGSGGGFMARLKDQDRRSFRGRQYLDE